ncbi:sprouty-4C [Burkholderia multivorans]|nr:sprouty-4C [Burkholderia multivorans]
MAVKTGPRRTRRAQAHDCTRNFFRTTVRAVTRPRDAPEYAPYPRRCGRELH